MTNEMKIANDLVVSMDYTLRLESGEIVDSSEGRGPLEFLQGHGQIIPGLERELMGMSVGETKDVAVAPADGYGERSADEMQLVPHDLFPEDLKLTEGMALQMREAETGRPLQAYVAEIRDEGVVLDFNHPLAGATLHFAVKIAGLRAATSEELAHGHVHGEGHAH
jgi:FKBP-type peptidyl-prolyl cis-trans isomerase SlyD